MAEPSTEFEPPADSLDGVELAVATPSERAFVAFRGVREVNVRFAPGFYDQANDTEMATELTRAARLAFAARARAKYDLLSEQRGERVRPGTDRLNREARDYRDRLDELVTSGASPDGAVQLVSTGLTDFLVSVAPGSARSLTEDSFRADCAAAALAYAEANAQQIARLKVDVYMRPGLEAAGVTLPW